MATQKPNQNVEPDPVTTQVAVVWALAHSRKHRHHDNCFCCRYGGLFCNAMDALWQNALNRELFKLDPKTSGANRPPGDDTAR